MNAHVRDNLNYLNDQRVDYVQRTTDFTGITSLQSTVMTAPSFTPISASRLLRITARWRSFTSTVPDDIFAVRINEVGVGQVNEVNIKVGSNGFAGGTLVCIVASPSAAGHTYAMAADRQLGSGTGTIQGSSTYPIQLIIEDIGAA